MPQTYSPISLRPFALFLAVAFFLSAGSLPAQEASSTKLCPDGHLCPALLDELDALIPGQLKTFDVPGAGVALIDNGQVVYSKGFGVRNLQTGAPFTPDTVYRIGSVSKAMTSMLAATEVDAGLFNWNTVVRTLRPSFKLPTEQLTDSVEVHDLMGMGTGLSDTPDVVYSDLFSPRYLWRALRTLPVTASPGTTFLYNNTVYAMGGYVGALAQGVLIPQLLTSYQSAMKTRIFDPIGMPTTAVTDNPQALSDNFAVSYRYSLPDDAPRHALAFQPIRAVAPAGAVASTLNDMERYLITQLQKGVAPNGARVVSAQNLQQTWQAQTKVNANFSYGMGWLTGSAYGMNILTHGGSIDSFETDVTMLPDSGVGIILFTNSSSGPFFYGAIRSWVVQKLAGVPVTALDTEAQNYEKQKAYVQSLRDSVLSFKADCTQAGPFAGTYERGWAVEYDGDNTLWLTRGDYYRAPLLQTARGYLVGTDEYHNVAWYVTLEQGKKARRLRITAVPADGSPEKLIDLITQTEAQSVSCPNAVTDQKLQAAIPQLDHLVENVVGEGRIPGLAVGIVYKGRVVYLNGFGVREAGKPDLVDPDTVFQLASVSKPLSSTIISSLVSEGTVKWDDPVVKYDPEFQLSDPTITSQVTIGDFFAHRSGLPGSAGNDLEIIGYRQNRILERLHFLTLAYPFRNGYQYSNFGLTEGALAAAKAAGERWSALARHQLFEPLGMTKTSMRYADFAAHANRAHLHILVNSQWTPALTRDADAQAPAGGASSSARDLTQWLLLELADGQYGGKQIISQEALNISRRPQAISGTNPDTGLANHYGFGWALDYLADGVFRMNHSGAFTLGAGTTVTLLPSQDLGIVVLGNAFPTGVPEAVADSLLDLTRYGHVTQDWFTVWKSRFDQLFTIPPQQQIEKYANPPVPNVPALDRNAYTGTYRNDYVGKVEITAEKGVLYLVRGVGQAPLPLRHWNGNTFLSYPVPENPAVPVPVEFTVGTDGKASQIMLEEFNGSGGGMVNRIR